MTRGFTVEEMQNIFDDYVRLGNKAEVARKYDLTRERIGQIIKELRGSKTPKIIRDYAIDWEGLNKTKKELRIYNRDIAEEMKIPICTINKLFSKPEVYGTTPTAYRVVIATLDIAQKRKDLLDNILECIVKE